MKTFLSEQMFQEMWEALQRGETYNYSDANTSMSISPNGLSIQYNYPAKQSLQDTEVQEFLDFCGRVDADVFTEACESFGPGELKAMEDALDTPEYQHTIEVFTQRVREIASNHLNQIINEADAEIKVQNTTIAKAEQAIEKIHRELDEAVKKYSL
jgi:hypothetical protein